MNYRILLTSFLLIFFLYTPFAGNAQVLYDISNLRSQDPDLVWAYDKIKIEDAWNFIKSSGKPLSFIINVGVIDTGVDTDHQEFKPNVNIDSDIPIDAFFFLSRELFNLPNGHGTQVAGIIGADNKSVFTSLPSNSPEMNGVISGVTTNYKLTARFIGGETATAALTLFGIQDAYKSGARFLNLSFGWTRCVHEKTIKGCLAEDEFQSLSGAFRDLITQLAEALFITAAGNDSLDVVNTIPAGLSALNLSNLVSVAATNRADARATFSNFGSAINIAAPGVDVYAPAPNNRYSKPGLLTGFSGTSAAAPMVTGVAAILKVIKPELTPGEIKQILIQTGDPIQTDKPIGPRLNALKAVQAVLVPPKPPTPVNLFLLYPQLTVGNYLGLFWTKNTDSDFSSYKIFRATHSNITTADTLVATITNQNQIYFKDEGLAPGTYFYKVFAFNQAGLSSPSNELSGRVFGAGEVITRIPGAPEPGDTQFPVNVAIPTLTSGFSLFDCPRSITNPFDCTGPFFSAGPLIDEHGHARKFRLFSATISANLLNNIPNLQFFTHNGDVFHLNLTAADDTYFVVIPTYGMATFVSPGTPRIMETQVLVLFGNSPITTQSSSGVSNPDAGFLTVVP